MRRNVYAFDYEPNRWERSRFAPWLYRKLYVLGVCTSWSSCYQSTGSYATLGAGSIWTRSRRPYVLGWRTDKWRCLLRFHHWPAPHEVAFGMCGKCLPWPCCGATTESHAEGCMEDARLSSGGSTAGASTAPSTEGAP